MFICLFVRFYLFLKLQFLLGYLIPWKIERKNTKIGIDEFK